MPKQIQSDYEEVRIPFTNMSFSPDIPSTNLSPNEYNSGMNVETDVRGIRSVAGDQEILSSVPGTPTFLSGGFRQDGDYWFIVATTEGYWYATNGNTVDWYNITPGGGPIAGYTQSTNIMDVWNGNIPFFNDTVGAPMFWPEATAINPLPILTQYSNLVQPATIIDSIYLDSTTYRLILDTPYSTPPYVAGQQIVITDVNNNFNGVFVVVACSTSTIDYIAVPGAAYPVGTQGTVSPAYTWNYNPNWKTYIANFLRIYNTPNVGSILVAGDLTVTNFDDTITKYPVTVQWSQAFGLNQAPRTWEPTITNVANQLEVPLRGPCIDAFPCNGQLFLCSYWDTVVFSPLNYSTTSAPILGVRLYNQGRGLLTSNAWANTDTSVYGMDSRDVWVFDGSNFKGVGNQRVKNWLFDQLDPANYERVFMETNTNKNQIEIYYPDKDATNGVPNKMIAYRYDLDVWNAPRDVDNATFATESPIWTYDASWAGNYSSRTVVYARGITTSKLTQKDYGFTNADGSPIHSIFRRDNIKLLKDYSGKLMVHRLLPESVNLGGIPFSETYNKQIVPSTGNLSVRIDGAESVGQSPVETVDQVVELGGSNPWAQIDQNSHRVNSITLENTSDTDIWICSATTWQFTQTEDDR